MKLDELETAIEINDYNLVDTLNNKIQLYDVVSVIKDNKFLLYLILRFINHEKCEAVEFNNLSTEKLSTITLKDRKKRLLLVTGHYMNHEEYGPKLKTFIEKYKNKSLAKPKLKDTIRAFVIYRKCYDSEKQELKGVLDFSYLKTVKDYRLTSSFNYWRTRCITNLADYNNYGISDQIKCYNFDFAYNYKKQSIFNGFEDLKIKLGEQCKDFYILTKSGFISILDADASKLEICSSVSPYNYFFNWNNQKNHFEYEYDYDAYYFKLNNEWYNLARLSYSSGNTIYFPNNYTKIDTIQDIKGFETK